MPTSQIPPITAARSARHTRSEVADISMCEPPRLAVALSTVEPSRLRQIGAWDLAVTEKTEFNDPDWTVGIKLGRNHKDVYWLLDLVRYRANPGDVERILLDTAM